MNNEKIPVIQIGPTITTNRRPEEILQFEDLQKNSGPSTKSTIGITPAPIVTVGGAFASVLNTRIYNLTTDTDITAGANVSGSEGIFDNLTISDTVYTDILDATTIYGSNIDTLTGKIEEFRTGRIVLREGTNTIEFRDPAGISGFVHTITPDPLTFSRILTLPDHAGSFAISGGTMDTYFNSVKLAGASAITNSSNVVLTNQRGAVLLATSTGSVNISGSDPLAGQVLVADGAGAATWAFGGSGITSLNGSTNAIQTFAYGTAGTAPAWSTASGTHTLNIPNAGASVTGGLITNGTQTIAGSKTLTGDLYVDIVRTVDYIYFNNGSYIEAVDSQRNPPAVRIISTHDWQIGGSHSSDLNKQASLGYSAIFDGGLVYAYEQNIGGAKPFFIGYPGLPSNTTTSGALFSFGGRPVVSGHASGNANIGFGANVASTGALSVSSGGISVSKTGTGIYRVTFDCTKAYGITASIAQAAAVGFITVQTISAAIFDVYVYDSTLVATDWAFNINGFGYKA